MYYWFHSINELDSRKKRDARVLHRRYFLHIRPGSQDDELSRDIFGGHLEIVLRKRPDSESNWGVALGVGGRGSETPFDGHIKLAGQAIYWGINQGGALGGWLRRTLSRVPETYANKWESREISAYTYNGVLNWKLWTFKHSWTRGQFAPWRESHTSINLLDRLWGEYKYSYTEVDSMIIRIDLPEGSYAATARLQEQVGARPRGGQVDRSWTVSIDAPDGIPDRYDPSGGWKGDRVYGFSFDLPTKRNDWWKDATYLAASSVLKTRGRTGFREALKD